MKAHARSVTNPLPYVTYSDSWGVKRHDSMQSALNYIHDNNPVRKVTVKPMGRYLGASQWEIWAESMVSNKPVFMGVLEKES